MSVLDYYQQYSNQSCGASTCLASHQDGHVDYMKSDDYFENIMISMQIVITYKEEYGMTTSEYFNNYIVQESFPQLRAAHTDGHIDNHTDNSPCYPHLHSDTHNDRHMDG